MTWVKLDDGMPDHPKVAPLSHAAFRLQVHGLCYAARGLTDGFIPAVIANRLLHTSGRKATAELLSAGVWEEVDGGYQIHDYAEYQPSAAAVVSQRQQAKERVTKFRQRKRPPSTPVTPDVTRNKRRSNAPPEPEPGVTPSGVTLAAVTTTTREPFEQWDGLVDVFGEPSDRERTLYGKAAHELKADKISRAGVNTAAELYPLEFNNAALTVTALANHARRLLHREAQIRAKANGTSHAPKTAAERMLHRAGIDPRTAQ